jgi:predicted permease
MKPWGIKRLFAHVSRTRDQVRTDIADEFAFHLDMRTDELVREGLPRDEARRQASQEFGRADAAMGTLAAIGDRLEQRRRVAGFLGELWQDAGHGLRLLRRSPGFAMVAILTLALGIGANTAIYSVLDAIILRPLPYPEPDRIVMVSETLENGSQNSVSGGAYLDWRRNQTQFHALVLTGRVSYNLRHGGATERLRGMEVSHEFLEVLAIPPLVGRGFIEDDDRPGGRNDVVLITEELWRSRFGADPAIVGRAITLDEVPRIVIGVLPAGAWLFREELFFVPAVLRPGSPRAERAPHWAAVFGRLRSDTTAATADAELKTIKKRLNAEYPTFKRNWGVVVEPVADLIGGFARAPLLILLGAVSLVLLIACVNVANLLLARGCHRAQELAVRAALGASGWRLARQVLTENLMLALLGGVAGVGLAYMGVELIRASLADALPLAITLRLDWQVLAFALAVTLLSGPLVGLLPALRARRPDLSAAMNTGSKGASASGRHKRTQSLLVVAEVALTVVLLASAGLLLRSLANATAIDPGFDAGRVLAFELSLPDVIYDSDEKRLTFADAVVASIRTLPGVEAAGTGMGIPFSGGAYGEYFRRAEAPDIEPVIGRLDFVSPGFLEALGTRPLAGRRFTDADNVLNGPRVVVINDTARRMFFPDGHAVGRPITIQSQTWDVVGVVADVVDRRLDVPRGPYAYVPSAFNVGRMSVAVRTSLAPMTLVNTVRAAVARIDPGVAIASPRSLDRAMAESMAQRKVVLGLVALFAVSALLLAAIGLYGVMAYSVATRQREFGIRMAFGAVRQDLIRQVLRTGLSLTIIGLVAGLAGAVALSRLLASELYEVRGSDPLVITGTSATVVLVAIAACLLPAWRAARVEPMGALRVD